MTSKTVSFVKIQNLIYVTSVTAFLFHRLGSTSIPAWTTYRMPSEVWDAITYPFPNFIGYTTEVEEWVSNFIQHITIDVITYTCWNLR